jgi:hypothetical protein
MQESTVEWRLRRSRRPTQSPGGCRSLRRHIKQISLTGPPGGHFSPFTSGIPLTNAASLRGFTDGGGALPPLLLHRSETLPNLTPLGKCQTHPPLPSYQTSQHSQRRAHSAVTLCLCLPKPRRLLTSIWALLLLLIMRGFSYKLQKGEPRSCSDRQDVRGSVHLSSQNAG